MTYPTFISFEVMTIHHLAVTGTSEDALLELAGGSDSGCRRGRRWSQAAWGSDRVAPLLGLSERRTVSIGAKMWIVKAGRERFGGKMSGLG